MKERVGEDEGKGERFNVKIRDNGRRSGSSSRKVTKMVTEEKVVRNAS